MLARLLAYIAAHERCYADDDWTRLEPFFTEDAGREVSGGPPLGGSWQGRAAVIRSLRERTEALDRRFDQRTFWPRGVPAEMGDSVALPWRGIYRLDRALAHPLTIEGTLIASFANDRIALLRDRLRPGTDRLIAAYLKRHPF
jgi:hypothetical protein